MNAASWLEALPAHDRWRTLLVNEGPRLATGVLAVALCAQAAFIVTMMYGVVSAVLLYMKRWETRRQGRAVARSAAARASLAAADVPVDMSAEVPVEVAASIVGGRLGK